jgi:hypothetical protein
VIVDFKLRPPLEAFGNLTVPDNDGGNFGDAVVGHRLTASRLCVDHHVRKPVQRVRVRLGLSGGSRLVGLGGFVHQHPATIGGAAELGPAAEHCLRHVLSDDPRRARKAADVTDEIDNICRACREEVLRASRKQGVFRLGVNSATQFHGSSRVIGHVMQCGPPPPRTSSPPSKVMAAL